MLAERARGVKQRAGVMVGAVRGRDGEGDAASRGWLAWVAASVVAAGLLRLAVAWGLPSTPLGDELYYTETALRIERGEGHVFGPHRMHARWPPGQSWWLSHFVSPEVLAERPGLLRELAAKTPAEMDDVERAFLRRAVLASVTAGTALVALTAALAGRCCWRRWPPGRSSSSPPSSAWRRSPIPPGARSRSSCSRRC